MKKTLLSLTLCVAALAATGCNKKGGGGKGGDVSDEVFTKAFKGAVSIGGNPVALGDGSTPGSGDYKPSDSTANTIKLNNSKTVKEESKSYDFTYEYSFSIKNPLEGHTDVKEYLSAPTQETTFSVYKALLTAYQTATDHDTFPCLEIGVKAKTGDKSKSATANIYLCPMDKDAIKMSLAEIGAKHSSLNSYAWTKVNPDVSTAYKADLSKAKPDQAKFFVETWGKLVYMTDDANWALLANGKNAIQLYQCSGWEQYKGKNIIVKGTLGFGYGNTQISYMYEMSEITDTTAYPVTEPDLAQEFSTKVGDVAWWNNSVCNATGVVTGAKFNGSVQAIKNINQGGDTQITPITDSSKVNCTSTHTGFAAKTSDGKDFIVEFDYHSCKDSSNAVGTKATAWIKSLMSKGSGADLGTVKGCLRWINDRNVVKTNGDTIYTQGYWRLTPYAVDHIPAV